MEGQADGSSLEFPAETVAHAFVEQFYKMLHEHADVVYRFYHESSMMSRPGGDGMLTTVTSLEGIKDLFQCLDYSNSRTEIYTVDAQPSYMKGVIIIVTGFLTDNDHGRRKFTESFFLAPMEKSYFVLNDVVRFLDEETQQDDASKVKELVKEVSTSTLTLEPRTTEVLNDSLPVQKAAHIAVNNVDGGTQVESINNGSQTSAAERSIVKEGSPADSRNNGVQTPADSRNNGVQTPISKTEYTPEKSYASIVSSGKPQVAKASGTLPSASANTGLKSGKAALVASSQASHEVGAGPTQSQIVAKPSNASEPSPQAQNGGRSSKVEQTEDTGHSIYIGDLPHDATAEQVEKEFKKYGTIKKGGVQVRRNKDFFFGFVEFESATSMQKAIEVKTFRMGGKEAFIQVKRTATRVGGNSFRPRPDGYRNGNFNDRADFYSGRGAGYERDGYRSNNYGTRDDYERNNYGRNDYGRRGDFHDNDNGNGYSRANVNGGGRGRGRGGGGRQGAAQLGY